MVWFNFFLHLLSIPSPSISLSLCSSLKLSAPPSFLHCSITGSNLLLTNSFKAGSKVYTTKAGVHEKTLIWRATRSLGSEFSICIHSIRPFPNISPFCLSKNTFFSSKLHTVRTITKTIRYNLHS